MATDSAVDAVSYAKKLVNEHSSVVGLTNNDHVTMLLGLVVTTLGEVHDVLEEIVDRLPPRQKDD